MTNNNQHPTAINELKEYKELKYASAHKHEIIVKAILELADTIACLKEQIAVDQQHFDHHTHKNGKVYASADQPKPAPAPTPEKDWLPPADGRWHYVPGKPGTAVMLEGNRLYKLDNPAFQEVNHRKTDLEEAIEIINSLIDKIGYYIPNQEGAEAYYLKLQTVKKILIQQRYLTAGKKE